MSDMKCVIFVLTDKQVNTLLKIVASHSEILPNPIITHSLISSLDGTDNHIENLGGIRRSGKQLRKRNAHLGQDAHLSSTSPSEEGAVSNEEDCGTASGQVLKQCLNPIRVGESGLGSSCSDDPADVVPDEEGIKQHVSAVKNSGSKTRKVAAVGVGNVRTSFYSQLNEDLSEETRSSTENEDGLEVTALEGPAYSKPKTREAEEARSNYYDIRKCPDPCHSCGGPHHRHLCLSVCKKCNRDLPRDCGCWSWKKNKNKSVSSKRKCSPPVVIPTFEAAKSCSKKKHYNALRDFCLEFDFVWRKEKSARFDVTIQGWLRWKLLAMRKEDKSILYRRAKSYYNTFKLGQEHLDERLRKFCVKHPEVLRPNFKLDFASPTCWSDDLIFELGDLIQAGAKVTPECKSHQKALALFYSFITSVDGQAAWSNRPDEAYHRENPQVFDEPIELS